MLDEQKSRVLDDRNLSQDFFRLGKSPRDSAAESMYAIDDSSRRTSMVFTIDEKDLYGQWNSDPSPSCVKEPDSATIDEKLQEWRSGCLLKFFYIIGALAAAITTYLLYRAYLHPAPTDFEE